MPGDWSPVREDERGISIAFWSTDEFLTYTRCQPRPITKTTAWVLPSYSLAWFQLASIATWEQQFDQALFCLDCAAALESDHPALWMERGLVLSKLARHVEALASYVRAESARTWVTDGQVAAALRGQGYQLIELGRLDEAEAVLRQSLEREPNSEVAQNELHYIEQVRHDRAERKRTLPWFLKALVNPPTDPLTIQLVALVADLPSIPGPQTVGAENYSLIASAFLSRGWAGFEEVFDQIVSRERADYSDIKRDLLREPILRTRVHRTMSEMIQKGRSDEEDDAAATPRQKRRTLSN